MPELAALPDHLYYTWWTCWDACYGHPGGEGCYEVRKCPITRITKKRIYFQSDRHWERDREFFVDRADMEREGSVYHRHLRQLLSLEMPKLQVYRRKSVAELRREMADCHPDRGGDPAEFRKAHARYAAAKAVR